VNKNGYYNQYLTKNNVVVPNINFFNETSGGTSNNFLNTENKIVNEKQKTGWRHNVQFLGTWSRERISLTYIVIIYQIYFIPMIREIFLKMLSILVLYCRKIGRAQNY